MNFYMNIGPTYYNDLGRQLYQEIALIEEQHVSQYGSLMDPTCTWLESLSLHEYVECYLYYSFYQDEKTPYQTNLGMHLQRKLPSCTKPELLAQHENKDWQQVIPNGTFPNCCSSTTLAIMYARSSVSRLN